MARVLEGSRARERYLVALQSLAVENFRVGGTEILMMVLDRQDWTINAQEYKRREAIVPSCIRKLRTGGAEVVVGDRVGYAWAVFNREKSTGQ